MDIFRTPTLLSFLYLFSITLTRQRTTTAPAPAFEQAPPYQTPAPPTAPLSRATAEMTTTTCEALCAIIFFACITPFLAPLLCLVYAAGSIAMAKYHARQERKWAEFARRAADIPGETYPNGYYLSTNRQGGTELWEKRPLPFCPPIETIREREAERLRSEAADRAPKIPSGISPVLYAAQKQRAHEDWERRHRLDHFPTSIPHQPLYCPPLPAYAASWRPISQYERLMMAREAEQEPKKAPITFRELQRLSDPSLEPFQRRPCDPMTGPGTRPPFRY